MGVSRSATTVIAYVMWKRQLRFPEALEFVRSRHADTDPNAGFVQQLKDYQCFLVSAIQFPQDERDVFRCQCGALLFQTGDVAHTGENCDQYYLKVAEWMRAWGDDGVILCFLCRKELGRYHNEGGRTCACGESVMPFYFVEASLCIRKVVVPKEEVAVPREEVATLEEEAPAPKRKVAASKGGVAAPKGGVAVPKGGVAAPKGGIAVPKGKVAVSKGKVAKK